MPVVTLSRSNSVTRDTYLNQASPSSSFGAAAAFAVGVDASSKVKRGLLYFDLGLIPNDAIINSAVLKLMLSSSQSSKPIDIHKVTSAWSDSATWNSPPSYDTNNPISVQSGTTAGAVDNFDITSIVRSWVDGSLPNNGVLLKHPTEMSGSGELSYYGYDSGDPAKYPQLTIDYTIPSKGKKQVEYVGHSKDLFGSTSSITAALPTGIQAGDLLVAQVTHSGTSAPAISGWTLQYQLNNNGYHCVFTKIAGANEPNPTFSLGSSVSWQYVISAYRNVKGIEAKSFASMSNTYNFDPPATGVLAKTKLLALSIATGVSASGVSNFTPPLSFADDVDYYGQWSQALSHSYLHQKNQLLSADMRQGFSRTNGYGYAGYILLEPITNNPPTLTLTSPANNQVLSEGNTLPVEGSATEADVGNVVTIYCQINSQPKRTIYSAVSNGSPISFSEVLTFLGDRVYFEGQDISGPLVEGTPHTLKVWAEDDQQGNSNEETRSFTIQINDPPEITVDPYTPTQTGLIEPDTITLSGTASDPNGNTLTVTGKVNNGTAETLLSGVTSGNWSYTFPVSALQVGANTVTITATDQFGKERIKTFSLNKTEQKTPLTKGVARYLVIPPLGTAKEILAWLQREIGDLTVEGAASFVDAGQPEQYTAMSKTSVDLAYGIAEDELIGTVATPKADIVFKQTFTRANPESDESAVKLVGVIE